MIIGRRKAGLVQPGPRPAEAPPASSAALQTPALSRQERFRREYARFRPGWRDCLSTYRQLVDDNITETCSVLDLGCGHADWLQPELERAAQVVGADTDIAALRRNRTHARVAADAQRLPFPAGSFDLVTCAWLLEHIDRPLALAAEISRVLLPGGRVVFLTPNAWNYNIWLIRIVPGALHGHLAQRFYDRAVGDTYPVRYRVNTPVAIDRTFTGAGLVRVRLLTNSDPTYLGVNRIFYWASCEIERLLELGPLRSARVHLLGVYTKP